MDVKEYVPEESIIVAKLVSSMSIDNIKGLRAPITGPFTLASKIFIKRPSFMSSLLSRKRQTLELMVDLIRNLHQRLRNSAMIFQSLMNLYQVRLQELEDYYSIISLRIYAPVQIGFSRESMHSEEFMYAEEFLKAQLKYYSIQRISKYQTMNLQTRPRTWRTTMSRYQNLITSSQPLDVSPRKKLLQREKRKYCPF